MSDTVCRFCEIRGVDMEAYRWVKDADTDTYQDVKRFLLQNSLLHLYKMHDCTCEPPKDKDEMEWPPGLKEYIRMKKKRDEEGNLTTK